MNPSTLPAPADEPYKPAREPRTRPAFAAALVAVLLIGLSLAYLLATETPRGRITGRIMLVDTHQPLADADVYLTPTVEQDKNPDMRESAAAPAKPDEDIRERRHTHTDAEGRFVLTRVPAGTYQISATSSAHHSADIPVTVAEAKTAPVELRMTRSEPDLALAERQTVFRTAENPVLPVRGYVDAAPPPSSPKGWRDTLRVRLYRTRLSDVLRDKGAAAALGALGETYGRPSPEIPKSLLNPGSGVPAPRLAADFTIPITTADREGFFHERLRLGAHGPGLYLVAVTHGTKQVAASVLATDTSLVVKRSPKQILAYAANITTGVPLPGARIRYFTYGKVRAEASAGADGTATLAVNAPNNPDADAAHPLTVASLGDDEAVVSGNNFFYEESGSYVVHAYTDRTVYRPGDTVSYKGIARRKRDTGGGYDVPRNIPVTVEIRSPDGERLLREAKATDSHGAFHGTFDLSSEAPSGSYSMETGIGGETHTADVTVASYRKPEFAVTVTPDKPHYVRGESVAMTIEGKFYFGAPVAGAKVHYSVFRSADWSARYAADTSDDSEDDSSDDEGDGGHRGYYGSMVVEGDATLGSDGKALVRFPADPVTNPPDESGGNSGGDGDKKQTAPEDIPQNQTFTLTASVTDNAKREVSADGVAKVSAGDFALTAEPEGYLAAPGQPAGIVVRARDHDGKPVSGASVEVTPVYRKWNDQTNEEEDGRPLPPLRATTSEDGSALVTMTPPHSGDLRLVAKATDAGGRAIYDTAYLWVSGDDGGDLNTQYSDLSLHTDKRRYQPGDTARVLINADRTGQSVLLTVEGDRVYKSVTLPLTRRSTVVRVPVLESYGPNVTLSACYVRDKKFASSDTPLRVALTTKTLNVTVTADRPKYQPGETARYDIKIADARGRPVAGCPFSLGVVDESIYALRADDPSAIRHAFYPRRENRVNTDYSFSERYLGDADKSEPKITARRKFRDTAYWQPDLATDASGHAVVSVPLPDNLTTWRASVYACSDDTALGYALSKVIATKPFFVRLDTPRFLAQGDRTRFLTIVHNGTGADQSVSVRLQATGLARDGGAADTQTISVKSGQDGTVTWPLTAQAAGDAALRVTAWTSGGGGVQFTDGIEKTLPVKPWGRQQFTAVAGVLGRNSPSHAQTLLIDRAAVPDASRLVVRITPSVGAALVGGLDYLVGYPYGCTEQTLSRFVPDLLVQRVQRRTGQTLLTGSVKDADLSKMVRDGLTRLSSFQHDPSGGWGWWQHDKDDPFMTAYVLVGLATAREEGYPVSDSLLEKGRKAGVKLLGDAPIADKPFLLYALALAGDRETSIHEAPRLDLNKVAPDGLAYLVLLEKALGYNPNASRAYQELLRRAHPDGSLYYWKNPEPRWNGSDRMATALGLRALLAADPGSPNVPLALRWLMQSRTDGYFGDTRDTAWALTAFCDYLLANQADAATAPSGIVTVRVNGQPVESIDAAAFGAGAAAPGASARDAERLVRVPPGALHAGPNDLTVESASGATVFYTASLTQSIAAPDGQEIPPLAAPPQDAGLTITREYLRIVPPKPGDNAFSIATEDTGNRFRQGDNVRVRLTITAPKDLEYVLIEDPFPSGFEPTERGTADEEEDDYSTEWGWWYSNVDVRDDRIAVFARRLSKGSHIYEYSLRAQTPGMSRALPGQLQGMYAEDLRVETGDTRLEVTE